MVHTRSHDKKEHKEPEPLTHNEHKVTEAIMKGLGKLSRYPLPVPDTVRPWQEISEYVNSLETLDIILFSCPISWYSMQLQGGRWTHVGMIYKRDDVHLKLHDAKEPQNPAKILILESIIGKEEERTSGVDLADAKARLAPPLPFFFLFSLVKAHFFFLFFPTIFF